MLQENLLCDGPAGHKSTPREGYDQMPPKVNELAGKINYFCGRNRSEEIMKYKSGDAVRFLNETGGGKVLRVEGQGLVYVLTDDGFEIPVPEKELVSSGNFAEPVAEKTVNKPVGKTRGRSGTSAPENTLVRQPQPAEIPAGAPVELLIGFIPEDPGPVFASTLACFLINDSPYLAFYHMGVKEGGVFHHLASGMLEAETKQYVKRFDQTAISKISDVHVQVILSGGRKYTPRTPVDAMIPVHLVNFSKESYFRENDYFDEKAVLFHVVVPEPSDRSDSFEVPQEIIAMKQQGDTPVEAKSAKKEAVSDTLEVDLHMDELAMQQSQYTATSILALQLSRFHAAMEEALSKKLRRLVIIHGLGQGVLKMQIRKELQEKYPNYLYQDASFKEYGFGATLVHLTYETKQ